MIVILSGKKINFLLNNVNVGSNVYRYAYSDVWQDVSEQYPQHDAALGKRIDNLFPPVRFCVTVVLAFCKPYQKEYASSSAKEEDEGWHLYYMHDDRIDGPSAVVNDKSNDRR